MEQEGSTDPQSHLLFGVNIDSSSLLLQNGMPTFRGVGNEGDSMTLPLAANFISTPGTDFALNLAMTTSSCIDESGFLQSPDNAGQVNPPNRDFMKVNRFVTIVCINSFWFISCTAVCVWENVLITCAVMWNMQVHKSGSFGRSLDITRFSSYLELRSELACMFGLEGQLEDPMRSGWQLVFVDPENDVLLLRSKSFSSTFELLVSKSCVLHKLLGLFIIILYHPFLFPKCLWPLVHYFTLDELMLSFNSREFVSNVWCIKKLSLEEKQQMGNQGSELLNSVPIQRHSNSFCEDDVSCKDARNLSTGITSVGSLND
ncbi:hypothetical protein HHK36_023315 [Tetracentron sinense]|uniref:PB1 domain-containing protein n=1 Tax=Tetracentron sinense TaxID=13715 RepID=A0A834YNI0_TETSI|nr:hypothetical protein HHK36_023315 [Tetracentron sinense]